MDNNIDINILYELALNKILRLEKENLELNALLILSNSKIQELEKNNVKEK
jgi:hypothetical protein